MAIMDHVTPGITKIDFEDSLFVTTELDKDENLVVKGYIESRGGVVRNSVTKVTNYLIYKDGKEETTKYRKAMELVRDKDLEINVLSLKTFSDLLTMKETPGISEFSMKGRRFVAAGLKEQDRAALNEHLEKHGGIMEKSVTKKTDYLIYPDPDNWHTWENEEYVKALSLRQNGGSGISVVSFSTFADLSRITESMEFGTYPCGKDDACMPIRWIVVKKEKKKALLLSADGLDTRAYNEGYKDATWENCTLRRWLNGEFFDTAFTEDEKCRILLTKVRNEDNPMFDTPGGKDTEDRVFLLSIREAREMLTKIERRNGDWWWRRSPGWDSGDAANVAGDGVINVGGIANGSEYAVCPALWIELEDET